MTEGTESSSSARSKRYRERKKDGRVVVRLEIDASTRAGLVRYGLLAPSDTGKREEVAGAVGLLLDGISRRGLGFKTDWMRSLPCASRVMAACSGNRAR